ncbi:hypothetical protein V1477_017512 [Vespula maculifrons]|uniref:Uncharacterized protein n=1 Tax=Vespula maculifrons TaxID=7453 RepID=A0ABD2B684_VESMC
MYLFNKFAIKVAPLHQAYTTSIRYGLNLSTYVSSSKSKLASVETLAILRAKSCICLSGPLNSSVLLGISLDLSSHTKQLIKATICGILNELNKPLKIISVISNSSVPFNSQATRPFNSITSAAVQ